MPVLPRIAAAAIVVDADRRILMLKRAADAPVGAGEWAIPGGKLDAGERLDACVIRETEEETCLRLLKVRRIPDITEDLAWGHDQHFVTFYYIAKQWEGTPALGEPHKHVELGWFDIPTLLAAADGRRDDIVLFDPMRALVLGGSFNYV